MGHGGESIIAQRRANPPPRGSHRIGRPFPCEKMSAHIHILGICGTFMGGVAAIAKTAGFRVTGCDANVYPPMSEQLAALGIELTEGFDEGQLALRPDAWVI